MKEILRNKKVIIVSLASLIVVFILLITLKDSYAYYGGSNELPIIEATIGKLKPTIDKVYIEEENQLYTNNPNPNVTITWSDDNITEYCVTTESACTEFKLIDSNSKSVTNQITLTGEKEHTVNAYIKNKYGYTSAVKSSSITLDTTPPTISNLKTTEIQETSVTISFEGNDAMSGVSQYCYNTTNSNYKCDSMSNGVKKFTISGLESGTNYTVSVYLIDNAGNDNKANATQKQFTTISKSAGDVIIATSNSLETKEAMQARNDAIKAAGGKVEDDLRRFVGSYTNVTDNFICFGTVDQDQCKNDMDTYMYRIMGVDTSNRLKLIKATKIDNNGTTKFKWHNTYSTNTHWNESDLYKGLNGTLGGSNNYFIGNAKYSYMGDVTWTNLIDTSTYYYIGDTTNNTNPKVFQEESTSSFNNTKVGLMYLSDYLYASNADTNNWLFIKNGLNNQSNTGNGATDPSAEYEWTMTRYDYGGGNRPWYVYNDGTVDSSTVYNTWAVRPVFYLKSDVTIAGKGTLENPYMIAP